MNKTLSQVLRDDQLTSSPSPVKGFVNAALNIRGKDIFPNPFEIPRVKEVPEVSNGIVNEAMESAESTLTIGLPFKPNIGCRINFTNVPSNSLTPSKLFAEKLVFSPNTTAITPRSLSIISEETLDIGQELDLYQLQLENSINERKMRKTNILDQHIYQQLIFNQRLTDIVECSEANDFETEENEAQNEVEQSDKLEEVSKKQEIIANEDKSQFNDLITTNEENLDGTVYENESTLADSSYNDDSYFKTPTPFIRNYRKDDERLLKPPSEFKVSRGPSKESISSVKSSETESKSKSKVKSLIRSSIRRIMHSKGPNKKVKNDRNNCENIPPIDEKPEHHTQATTKLFDNLRYSLRRRTEKHKSPHKEEKTATSAPDISIIDQSERTMKLKTNIIQTDYIKIEELTNEKKPSFRNSIRKSTRGVRNHIMKSVFHKNIESGYEFKN